MQKGEEPENAFYGIGVKKDEFKSPFSEEFPVALVDIPTFRMELHHTRHIIEIHGFHAPVRNVRSGGRSS